MLRAARNGDSLLCDDFFRGDFKEGLDIEMHMDKTAYSNQMIDCQEEGKEYEVFAERQTNLVLGALDKFQQEKGLNVKVTSFWGMGWDGELLTCGRQVDCDAPFMLQRANHISHRTRVSLPQKRKYYDDAADVFTWSATEEQGNFVLLPSYARGGRYKRCKH